MKDIKEEDIVFSKNSIFKIQNGEIKANKRGKVKKGSNKPISNGSVGDFCLRCKAQTANKAFVYKQTANNRNIRSSLCVDCGTTKTTFVSSDQVV